MPTDARETRTPVTLRQEIWFAIADTRARMRGAMNADSALGPLGLTLRSYTILSMACTGNDYSQREIGDFLSFDARQVVNLVDDLEGLGYITREPYPGDRRVNAIRATAEGKRVHATAREVLREREEKTLGNLSPEERAQLLSLLDRIQG